MANKQIKQFPIQENQIGDFYLQRDGGDAVTDSELLTDVVSFRKLNSASNGNVLVLENHGSGYDLFAASGSLTISKTGDFNFQNLFTPVSTITSLTITNGTILNNISVGGNLDFALFDVSELTVTENAALTELLASGSSTFASIVTFNSNLIVNGLATFNSQILIQNVADHSLLIQGNSPAQIGIKVVNQKSLGYSYLKLEANSNLTSYPYLELARFGEFPYSQRLTIGSLLSFSFVSSINFTSKFTNAGIGKHNLLTKGTLQVKGPILSGTSSLLSIDKSTQILSGLILGNVSSTGFLKQISLAGNASLQIVTKQSTSYLSSIINNFANSSNSGILVGTTQSDGIAFRVANNIGLTAGLPSSNGTDQFIVFGNGGVSVGSSNNPGTGKLLVNTSIQLGATTNGALSGDVSALYLTKNNADNAFTVRSDSAAKLRLLDSAAGTNLKGFDLISDDGSFMLRSIKDDTTTKTDILKLLHSGNARILTGLEIGTANLVLTGSNDALYLNSKLALRATSDTDIGIETNYVSGTTLTLQNIGSGILKKKVYGNLEARLQNGEGGRIIVNQSIITPQVDFSSRDSGYITPPETSFPNLYVKKRNFAGNPPDLLYFWNGEEDIQIAPNFGIFPIGTILAWHGSLTGVPALPENWIVCSGGTITDVRSPIIGQAIPNLNNAPMPWSAAGPFIRGGTTSNATPQQDQMQGHAHVTHYDTKGRASGGGFSPVFPPGTVGGGADVPTTAMFTDTPSGTFRAGNETHPIYVRMVWIMRIF